ALLVEDRQDAPAGPVAMAQLAIPAIGDIARGAPQMAVLPAPQPRFVVAPLADRQDHRTAGCGEGPAHRGIGFARIALCRSLARIAPVIFDVVDAPARILRRILELIALAPGPARASVRAGITVDAEFETPRMKIVAPRLHAGRKAFRMRLDVAPRIALPMPAIVKIYIDIAGIAKARGDNCIGSRLDQVLVDLAAVMIPAVPAERRSERQAFGLLCLRRRR